MKVIAQLANGDSVVEMPVSEFVNLKPFSGQFSNGKARVQTSRVTQLIKIGVNALTEGTPIRLTSDNKIFAGNHRRAAVEHLIKEGNIDPNYIISVIKDGEKSSKKGNAIKAYIDNYGSNTKNKKDHQVLGDFDISIKIFTPIYEAIEKCKTFDVLTPGNRSQIARNLGAFLNNNPSFIADLIQKRPMNISGAKIYQAKSFRECKDDFYECKVNIDLRNYVDELAKVLSPGLNFLKDVTDSVVWDQYNSGRTKKLVMPLIYMVLSLSLRNKIIKDRQNKDGVKTSSHIFLKVLGKNGTGVKEIFDLFNTKTDYAEGRFNEEMGVTI